jgi:chitinase
LLSIDSFIFKMHSFKTFLTAGLLAGMTEALPKPAPTTAGDGEQLVIYWGAEGADPSLMDVCKDPSYDIVNLSFLSYFHKAGGFPEMHIGGLSGPSAAQKAAGATGLQDGSSLVPSILACQMAGKKVLLSLGGAKDYADSTFASDAEGVEFADLLWDLFGGAGGNGTNSTSIYSRAASHADLRPFGNVRMDGFDMGK